MGSIFLIPDTINNPNFVIQEPVFAAIINDDFIESAHGMVLVKLAKELKKPSIIVLYKNASIPKDYLEGLDIRFTIEVENQEDFNNRFNSIYELLTNKIITILREVEAKTGK